MAIPEAILNQFDIAALDRTRLTLHSLCMQDYAPWYGVGERYVPLCTFHNGEFVHFPKLVVDRSTPITKERVEHLIANKLAENPKMTAESLTKAQPIAVTKYVSSFVLIKRPGDVVRDFTDAVLPGEIELSPVTTPEEVLKMYDANIGCTANNSSYFEWKREHHQAIFDKWGIHWQEPVRHIKGLTPVAIRRNGAVVGRAFEVDPNTPDGVVRSKVMLPAFGYTKVVRSLDPAIYDWYTSKKYGQINLRFSDYVARFRVSAMDGDDYLVPMGCWDGWNYLHVYVNKDDPAEVEVRPLTGVQRPGFKKKTQIEICLSSYTSTNNTYTARGFLRVPANVKQIVGDQHHYVATAASIKDLAEIATRK